jgi:hypothetical protein
LKDLRQAGEFATYILEERLHEKKETKQRRLVHLAFATSLVVAYSRSFKRSKNLKGQREPSLQDYAHEVLTGEDELELHRRVVDMRDQAYAHSDANSNYFDLDYDRYAAPMKVVELLDKTDTELLRAMISKWISHVEAEKSKLKESVT